MISLSSTKEFKSGVAELERFIATLSVSMMAVKLRLLLQNHVLLMIAPLIRSACSIIKPTAPEPLSTWANQLAGDT